MRTSTKIAVLALTFASAPVFAQDRGPGSPNAPNTGQSGMQQSSPREQAMRNCEKLSGTERDNCMRDFQARTGSRTEPQTPADKPQTPEAAAKGSGGSTTVR